MNPPAVETKSTSNRSDLPDDTDYEVVVIGAGVGGIYQIKRLVDLGVSATVLEGDSDLGGTWYRNRYPGARFDSESFTYGYSCLLYTSPSPRDGLLSRMPSSA